MRKSIIVILFFCLVQYRASSQTVVQDSVYSGLSLKNTIDFYYNATGENVHFNNGFEYAGYDVNRIGHPFFDTTAMQLGAIYYDGILYKDLPLLFDICDDAVITNRYRQDYKIRLANDKIDSFYLLSHEFIRIVPDSLNRQVISIGFYDRVYNGKINVLVKRKKIIKDQPVVNGEAKSKYIAFENYFVKIKNSYFPVSTKKSIVKLFKDRDTEMRRFIKKNKLNFRKKPEEAIVQSVKYYDQLTN